eukprot:1139873-Pelagomonas_calceolata.AAC.5
MVLSCSSSEPKTFSFSANPQAVLLQMQMDGSVIYKPVPSMGRKEAETIQAVEPDQQEEAAKTFHEIAEAAEVLGNEEKRTRWENGEDLEDMILNLRGREQEGWRMPRGAECLLGLSFCTKERMGTCAASSYLQTCFEAKID